MDSGMHQGFQLLMNFFDALQIPSVWKDCEPKLLTSNQYFRQLEKIFESMHEQLHLWYLHWFHNLVDFVQSSSFRLLNRVVRASKGVLLVTNILRLLWMVLFFPLKPSSALPRLFSERPHSAFVQIRWMLNFLTAAATPFSEAYFPIKYQSLSLHLV